MRAIAADGNETKDNSRVRGRCGETKTQRVCVKLRTRKKPSRDELALNRGEVPWVA